MMPSRATALVRSPSLQLPGVRFSHLTEKASGAFRYAFTRAKKRVLPTHSVCCASALLSSPRQYPLSLTVTDVIRHTACGITNLWAEEVVARQQLLTSVCEHRTCRAHPIRAGTSSVTRITPKDVEEHCPGVTAALHHPVISLLRTQGVCRIAKSSTALDYTSW